MNRIFDFWGNLSVKKRGLLFILAGMVCLSAALFF